MTDYNELTGMEMGLLKNCSYKKHTILRMENDLSKMKTLSSRTIGKLGGVQAVLEYRAELGGMEQAYYLTTIREYTNKRGATSLKHYNVNGKMLPKIKDEHPVWVLCWVEVSSDTIHKWGIREDDVNFRLYPILPDDEREDESEDEFDIELED